MAQEDIAAFRAALPEFVDKDDIVISAALAETDMWLDSDMWYPPDFVWARWLLTAHHLRLAEFYGATIEGGAGLTGGMVGVFAKSIGIGERRVMFGERMSKAGAGGGISGPGEEMYEETLYGQKFLRLRSRNIHAIATV
jgi:hypothetical protein